MTIRNDRGITLIELIILIAIGSFIVSGTVLFTRQIALNANQARSRLAAMDTARLQMETMKRTPYDQLFQGNTDFDLNNFRVRQSVNVYRASTARFNEPNHWWQGDLRRPAGSASGQLSRVDITVDEPEGDFSTPILQLSTFRPDHVLEG